MHRAHIIFLGLWALVLAAETFLELRADDRGRRRLTARVHYWLDIVIELPLLAGILVTGTLLAWRGSPLSDLHLLKIACGLIAITANLYCTKVVIRRYRRLHDKETLWQLGNRIRLIGFTALPFGLLAAALGLIYFRR